MSVLRGPLRRLTYHQAICDVNQFPLPSVCPQKPKASSPRLLSGSFIEGIGPGKATLAFCYLPCQAPSPDFPSFVDKHHLAQPKEELPGQGCHLSN